MLRAATRLACLQNDIPPRIPPLQFLEQRERPLHPTLPLGRIQPSARPVRSPTSVQGDVKHAALGHALGEPGAWHLVLGAVVPYQYCERPLDAIYRIVAHRRTLSSGGGTGHLLHLLTAVPVPVLSSPPNSVKIE